MATVIGPTPPGTGGDVGRAFGGIFIHHVADHFAAFQTVDADIDHNRPFFNPLARNKARFAHRDDQQVGVFDMMAQVFCKAVGDGGGAAGQQQLHAHRATDDIGGANDHRIEAVGVDIVAFQQGHDTARSARTQARRALAQAANVVRMEAVDVFIRRDALENFDVIDPCRQGQLNQNTVDGLIGIQSVDKLQQLGFAGGFREIVRAGDEATSSHALRLLPT